MYIYTMLLFAVFTCIRGYQLDFIGVTNSRKQARKLLRKFYYKYIREEVLPDFMWNSRSYESEYEAIKGYFGYKFISNDCRDCEFHSELKELVVEIEKVNELRPKLEEYGLYSG